MSDENDHRIIKLEAEVILLSHIVRYLIVKMPGDSRQQLAEAMQNAGLLADNLNAEMSARTRGEEFTHQVNLTARDWLRQMGEIDGL
jgi:hypothetical protein